MNVTANEVIEQQRASWNKFAPGWQKWDAKFMEFFMPFGDAMIYAADLDRDAVILDVASGTGEPGLTAASRAPKGKVFATDLSEEMVRIAGENARARGVSNFETLVSDGGALPFPVENFDAVLCRFGIMFFPDPAAGIKEMARVLKKFGRLSLAVWTAPERNPWASTIGKIVNDTLGLPKPPPDAPGIFRFAEPGSAAKLLEEAGFADVTETKAASKLLLDSPEEYWDLMTEVAAPIAGALSQANAITRETIRAETLKSIARFTDGTKLSIPAEACIVSGTKV